MATPTNAAEAADRPRVTSTTTPTELPDFHHAPGHLFRRARQFHDALWLLQVSTSLTPLQYAVLTALELDPGIDQRTLGERIALDKSTIADLTARLAKRDFIVRSTDPKDRRRVVLTLTRAGRSALYVAAPKVAMIGREMLAALTADEGRELIRLLDKLVYSEGALAASGGRYPPHVPAR
jgi:MarR family transcriptional regulator, temperature-dependent positive regulator of motility